MKIVFQGEQGSFSHLAGREKLGLDHQFIGLPTFNHVFSHVKEGLADFGIIPIENSLIGSIYENYDLLSQYKLKIVGEYYKRIEHHLLGLSSSTPLKKVFSHPKALEQCTLFFEAHQGIEAVVYEDTAGAVRHVKESGHEEWGAIAGSFAGELYGLISIKNNIEDNPQNYTRFILVSNKDLEEAEADKCSIVAHLPHDPGSLYKLLERLKEFNMTKVVSRPIKGTLFEYIFYIDLEFTDRKGLDDATQGLNILGIYKKGVLCLKNFGNG
jgi:prephenate dehydratase